jgi:putative N6-adenine-specific DNA methylase
VSSAAPIRLFLPTAQAAPEAPQHSPATLAALECARILGREAGQGIHAERAGVVVDSPADASMGGAMLDAMKLNLHSRLAQRVLWPLCQTPYVNEDDLYVLARRVPWSTWIDATQTLRVDVTAQRAPLQSLNFVALRIKDAVCDAMREAVGARPSVDTRSPDLVVALHLTPTVAYLYVDLSGEPLFKRGWRAPSPVAEQAADAAAKPDPAPQAMLSHGEAPLKETLAAHLLAVAGFDGTQGVLLDPCCGAGTIAIEAAQQACGRASGLDRRFAFERLKPFEPLRGDWLALKQAAQAAQRAPSVRIHARDISQRMVRLAQANAQRAGVAHAIEFACGDATHMPAPPRADDARALIVTNPPFGRRVDARGAAQGDTLGFAAALAAHLKHAHAGWTAWVLCADPDFERAMKLKPSAKVPVWNGGIECRLLRLDMVAGAHRRDGRAAP